MENIDRAAAPSNHSASGARFFSLAAGWAYILLFLTLNLQFKLVLGSAMGDRDTRQNDPPSWDGNTTTWRHYQDEVRIWTLGQDLDVTYCLASRLIRNLSGAARRAALTVAEDDLLAIERNKKAGIQNVMAKLRETLVTTRS